MAEDDRQNLQALATQLEQGGFEVRAADHDRDLWRQMEEQAVDVLLLQVDLPGADGIALCRDIRADSSLPVLLMSRRDSVLDRVLGLEVGADDYLVLPVDPRELRARIRTVLRRARALPVGPRSNLHRRLVFGAWQLDTVTRVLSDPDGGAVPLSGAEYRLLRMFLDYPGQVLGRDLLVETLHGRPAAPVERVIDIQVNRLRQRLKDSGREPQLIKTVRGRGYMLAVPVTSLPPPD